MKILPFFILILLQFQLSAQLCSEAVLLDTSDFKEHIQKNDKQVLDVRTASEYHLGHIQGAIIADVSNNQAFLTKLSALDKNSPVYIYCRSGSRSKTAARLLCESGFKQVYDLRGGYLTWQ